MPGVLHRGALILGLSALAGGPAAAGAARADFGAEVASPNAVRIADWVVASGDNHGLSFVIVDKVQARTFVFYPDGRLRGAAAALVGLARGDGSLPGIGQRKLSDISPAERTTPAGRFVSSLGADLGAKDVVWVDYDAAISLHRVITSNPKEQRLRRLATATPLDNRITWGCINVPAAFFDTVVEPAFTGASGVVYILPEVRSLREVFPAYTDKHATRLSANGGP